MKSSFWVVAGATLVSAWLSLQTLAHSLGANLPEVRALPRPAGCSALLGLLAVCGCVSLFAQLWAERRTLSAQSPWAPYRLALPLAAWSSLTSLTWLVAGLLLAVSCSSFKVLFVVIESHALGGMLACGAGLLGALKAGRARPLEWRSSVTLGLAAPLGWFATYQLVAPHLTPLLCVWVKQLCQ